MLFDRIKRQVGDPEIASRCSASRKLIDRMTSLSGWPSARVYAGIDGTSKVNGVSDSRMARVRRPSSVFPVSVGAFERLIQRDVAGKSGAISEYEMLEMVT